jgi:hypothetical protein
LKNSIEITKENFDKESKNYQEKIEELNQKLSSLENNEGLFKRLYKKIFKNK